MATTVTNSITRVFSVRSNPPAVSRTHNLVSLSLVPHVRRRVLHRDVRGCLFTVFDSTDLDPTRVTRCFPPSCLTQPSAMREILSDALGLAIQDDDNVKGLALGLLDRCRRTRSLHLCAEFEVAQTYVITSREEDEEEEDEEDEEEWKEAIETIKVDYGFDSRGGLELGTCSICLDDLCCRNKKLIQTPCSHLYHESCIESWLEKKNNSCPLCRTRVLL